MQKGQSAALWGVMLLGGLFVASVAWADPCLYLLKQGKHKAALPCLKAQQKLLQKKRGTKSYKARRCRGFRRMARAYSALAKAAKRNKVRKRALLREGIEALRHCRLERLVTRKKVLLKLLKQELTLYERWARTWGRHVRPTARRGPVGVCPAPQGGRGWKYLRLSPRNAKARVSVRTGRATIRRTAKGLCVGFQGRVTLRVYAIGYRPCIVHLRSSSKFRQSLKLLPHKLDEIEDGFDNYCLKR